MSYLFLVDLKNNMIRVLDLMSFITNKFFQMWSKAMTFYNLHTFTGHSCTIYFIPFSSKWFTRIFIAKNCQKNDENLYIVINYERYFFLHLCRISKYVKYFMNNEIYNEIQKQYTILKHNWFINHFGHYIKSVHKWNNCHSMQEIQNWIL